ncbi:MAG: hypothetical protein ACOC1P_04495 [Minisyncoccales bacterium]
MKNNYEELQKKYTLPAYEELNKDFEIYSISKEDDLIRELLKKIRDVIDFYIDLLEGIIQPDSTYYVLKEANAIDSQTRNQVNTTYAKLLYINRENIEIHLDYNEKKATEFILKTHNEWQEIKKELMPIIKTIKESWAHNKETKNEGGYFG